jgi:hypothetical protein
MMVVVPGVMVVPGPGGGFRNAPSEHDSCGENSERRA